MLIFVLYRKELKKIYEPFLNFENNVKIFWGNWYVYDT